MRSAPPVLPPDDEQRPYRSTLFDRLGPAAGLYVRLAGQLVLIGAGFLVITMLLTVQQEIHGLAAVAFVLVGTVGGTALAAFLTLGITGAGGAVASAVTMPSGSSVPYEEDFSYQEAMAVRGDVAGALESYEAIIAERPDAHRPRLRAAELYAAGGRDLSRAATLFRSVRDMPGVPRSDALRASTRLVDLYDGPLGEPGRALVELRRIVEQFPGSPAAEHARRALPGLKARLAAEQGKG